jgi:hypothetical protein
MPVAPSERMRRAAAQQLTDVLNTEERYLERDVKMLLSSVDVRWSDREQASSETLQREVCEFELALRSVGVHTVPRLRESFVQALQRRASQEITLKLDTAQYQRAEADLRKIILTLTTWMPGAPPIAVFSDEQVQPSATVADAAESLCFVCVLRDMLIKEHLARTQTFLHLLAPRLSAKRLAMVESCLRHVEEGSTFEPALRPGFTGTDRIGVVPLWPNPTEHRQRWGVVAGRSWVVASPLDMPARDDIECVTRQMGLQWERTALPKHGAALTSVLVEVAIATAARRAQVLGRTAEEVFSLDNRLKIREALDRLAGDLAELNAGLDELETATTDSRTDLERHLSRDEHVDTALYRVLGTSLDKALTKLDRQQQRLHSSFLAAREHAASRHVADTISELRRHQESIAINQRTTDDLNKTVGRLTIMLLGPTVVFGALSVTDHWLLPKNYAISVLLLVAYVFMGLGLSLLIRARIDYFTRLFAPSTRTPIIDQEIGSPLGAAAAEANQRESLHQ